MHTRLPTLLAALLLTGVAAATAADVVVVVARNSPIESLSSTQLSDIYLGRLKQLTSGTPVIPVDQTESSPAREAFYQSYLGRTLAQIQAHWSRLIFIGRGSPPRALADSRSVAELVAGNTNTIGYIEAAALNEQLRVVKID